MLSCFQADSPEKIVKAYKDALNSHDVDSLLRFYSDDIVFNIPALMMNLSGKDDLRGVAEYDSVLKTNMEISNITVNNDTILCSIRETNDWMNTVGISSAFYPNSMFVVRGNKIVYIEADLADSSLNNFQDVFNSFLPWAKQTNSHALDSLMPEGKFQFNAKNGIIYLELLKEWRKSTIQ
jgi:hypothetical protein